MGMPNPEPKLAHFRAAVFDLDGTLVDNMRFHLEAWKDIAGDMGVHLSPERFGREFAGRKNQEILPLLLGRALPPDELERLAEAKEARYRELYAPHLAAVRGGLALIDALRARGVQVAVATAAPAKNRQMVLGGLHLFEHLDAVVGSEDVRRGKPHPDLFLAAAEKLEVQPRDCLVFEDAVSGVQAGVAAGMEVLGVTTTVSAEALLSAGAKWTSPDFEQLPPVVRARLGLETALH
jgi:beta-phosphoglucomutase family hydrolase